MMEMSGFVNCALTMLTGVAASLVLVALARRFFSTEVLRSAHDVTGALLAVTGTLYAVALGMIVVDSMTRFEQAADTVQQESNCLVEVFLLSRRIPEPFRSRVRQGCRQYAAAVIDEEWAAMAAGRASPAARDAMLALTRSIDAYEPMGDTEQAVFPILVEQVAELWRHRRERLGTAMSGVPAIEWVALFVGATLTVLFSGLFAVSHSRLHVLLTAMVALSIGINLYLVSLFGYPFAGDLSVSSDPFRRDLAVFADLQEEGAGQFQGSTTSSEITTGRPADTGAGTPPAGVGSGVGAPPGPGGRSGTILAPAGSPPSATPP